MPYEILTSPHPDVVKMHYYGDLEATDIITDVSQIDRTLDKPFYLLIDVADLNIGLPDFFLEAARKSITSDPVVRHLAIYVPQAWLRSILTMILKLLRLHGRLTMHDSMAAAEQHVMQLVSAQEK